MSAIETSRTYMSKSLVGTTLCQTADTIYRKTQKMGTLLGNVKSQPSRAMNAVWTLWSSSTQLLSGNPLGVIGLISGGREVLNLSSSEKNSDLQQVLSDIGADAEMIGVLAQSQEGHHQIIEENLGSIKDNIQDLYSRFDAIQQLNTQGFQELQQRKSEALSLNKQAVEHYKNAEKLFIEAQRASKHSHRIFQKCSGLFNTILNLAKTPDQEISMQQRIERLEKIAYQASHSCKNGQAKLDLADQKFIEAFAAFQLANTCKDKAIAEIAKAVQQAEDVLKAGQEKAQYTHACMVKIQNTQQELAKAKEDNKDILFLVDSLKQEVVQAKEAARGKLGFSEVVVGIAAAATVPVGPATALTLGLASAYGYHYSDTLTHTAKGIYNYVVGTPSPAPICLQKHEILRVAFDQVSSGKWGAYVMKRPSFTVGTLYIDLGDPTPISYRFNLNNEYPVAKEDLVDLFQQLAQALDNNRITPARCLAILQELKTVRMDRGERFDDVNGIIHPHDGTRGIVRHLETLCEKRIARG